MDINLTTPKYESKKCPKCGETMIFKGLGEYTCEQCHYHEFDDYGKVRNYIEVHKGCNAVEIEQATGVSRREINRMLKEERIEVSKDSKIFLKCERCGKSILTGRYCEECQIPHRNLPESKQVKKNNAKRFGSSVSSNLDGEVRFKRMK